VECAGNKGTFGVKNRNYVSLKHLTLNEVDACLYEGKSKPYNLEQGETCEDKRASIFNEALKDYNYINTCLTNLVNNKFPDKLEPIVHTNKGQNIYETYYTLKPAP